MITNLKSDCETLDDLQCGGLCILQKKDGYKFSTDSVLLSNFVKARPKDVYVDLCSGCGVVALLAQHKNNIQKCFAVELQAELSEMAERSMKLNKKEIKVLNIDLKNAPKVLGSESVDVISVNPPYHNAGEASENDQIAIAMHELKTNLSEIILASKKLLKFGGKLFMVYRADRLAELMFKLKSAGLEPKTLRVVYPKLSKEPNLVLIEARKGAKEGIIIQSPLILMDEEGNETEELKNIYNRNAK